jgi:hypothetical protein
MCISRRICYSSGSKFSYSDFALSRVGDPSLSESTDPSVKHVGSVQLTRFNLKNESCRSVFYHSTRTIGQKVETLDSEFASSLCRAMPFATNYAQLPEMAASVNPATATSGLDRHRDLSGPPC